MLEFAKEPEGVNMIGPEEELQPIPAESPISQWYICSIFDLDNPLSLSTLSFYAFLCLNQRASYFQVPQDKCCLFRN